MQLFNSILYVIQVFVAIALVGLILIQHGKGADAGAAFGSGSSATVFGSRGAGTFLGRLTAVLAAVFIGNSLLLAYVATTRVQQQATSVLDTLSSEVIEQTSPSPLPQVPEMEQNQNPVPTMDAVPAQRADIPAEMEQGMAEDTAVEVVPLVIDNAAESEVVEEVTEGIDASEVQPDAEPMPSETPDSTTRQQP